MLKDSITITKKNSKQKNCKRNQITREKHCKWQNYCKHNPCEQPWPTFYISKGPQTRLHKKYKNKTDQPREEQNWQNKQIHLWQNKQQTKKYNTLKSMERHVRSHQLVQQNRRKK